MKKLTKALLLGCITFLLAFGLTACGDKPCEHTYDNACDTICNLCSEERTTTHTPEEDDGDCTTDVLCVHCPELLVFGNYQHEYAPPTISTVSDNTYVTQTKCTSCEIVRKTTLIFEGEPLTLIEQKGMYGEPVFSYLAELSTYSYKLDAGGNENVMLSIYFYVDETCDGFYGSGEEYGMLEFEIFTQARAEYLGIRIVNGSNEDITVTITVNKLIAI